MTKAELLERIAGLSAPYRLRLAASLIEAGKPDLAEALVRDVSEELAAR